VVTDAALPPVISRWPWAATSLVAVAAVALGVFADEGQRLPGWWAEVPELGSPWILLAFVGARVWHQSPFRSILVGFLSPLIALGTYFLYVHVQYDVSMYNLLNDGRGAFWFGVAISAGLFAAIAGTLSRVDSVGLRSGAWGAVTALPVAEIEFVAEMGRQHFAELRWLLLAMSIATALFALRQKPAHWWFLAGFVAATAAGVLGASVIVELN